MSWRSWATSWGADSAGAGASAALVAPSACGAERHEGRSPLAPAGSGSTWHGGEGAQGGARPAGAAACNGTKNLAWFAGALVCAAPMCVSAAVRARAGGCRRCPQECCSSACLRREGAAAGCFTTDQRRAHKRRAVSGGGSARGGAGAPQPVPKAARAVLPPRHPPAPAGSRARRRRACSGVRKADLVPYVAVAAGWALGRRGCSAAGSSSRTLAAGESPARRGRSGARQPSVRPRERLPGQVRAGGGVGGTGWPLARSGHAARAPAARAAAGLPPLAVLRCRPPQPPRHARPPLAPCPAASPAQQQRRWRSRAGRRRRRRARCTARPRAQCRWAMRRAARAAPRSRAKPS